MINFRYIRETRNNVHNLKVPKKLKSNETVICLVKFVSQDGRESNIRNMVAKK